MHIRTLIRTVDRRAMLVLATGVSLVGRPRQAPIGQGRRGHVHRRRQQAVRVLLDDGQVSEVPLDRAVARRVHAAEARPHHRRRRRLPSRTPRRPDAAPKTVTVPAGTTMNVRLTQAIDVDASRPGMTFKARGRRSGDGRRLDRHSARRVGRPPGRPRRAVGQDEGQRQDHAEAERHRVRRHRLPGRHAPTSRPKARAKARRRAARSAAAPAWAPSSAASPAAAKGRRWRGVGGVTGAAVAVRGEEHLKLPAETRLQFS